MWCLCMLSRFSRVWLCNPMDCSPPGFPVRGILQARILEWVAISSSRGILLTQGSNQRLSKPSSLAGGIFTSSATWEAVRRQLTHKYVYVYVGTYICRCPYLYLLNDGGISHIHIYIYIYSFNIYVIYNTCYYIYR